MPGTDTTPESVDRVETAEIRETERVPSEGGDGLGRLLKDLMEDTRTLVQQEIELVRMEVGRSFRRLAVDGAWIWAGAVVLTVGLLCLALALALGLGALLDSYWLGALITGGTFLLVGAILAWRGVRDLRSGGLLPSNPLESLQENREWARRELNELKQGITEER
ncbi:MAG: phage holin family protein [Longimicrobiales bacterium]|nr:phage holin family protein [Longimicrobiales bacterium]